MMSSVIFVPVAQWTEHLTSNPKVAGSIPVRNAGSKIFLKGDRMNVVKEVGFSNVETGHSFHILFYEDGSVRLIGYIQGEEKSQIYLSEESILKLYSELGHAYSAGLINRDHKQRDW